ncbi:hypothetical protein [Herbaspirillum aquaticum]|uniref:hypothetical protein n=1 Tax=Herbaspirillum aquaticum TaxID=568783 RepID=UPI0024DEEEF6|nr:hypothetical protein [Herbaspirillum aquaticum]
MREKIDKALMVAGFMLPAGVKQLLKEVGTELDRLRAEVDELKRYKQEKESNGWN